MRQEYAEKMLIIQIIELASSDAEKDLFFEAKKKI